MDNDLIIIETQRLILRRFAKEDLKDLFKYLCNEEVVKYEPYKPMNLEATKENLEWRISTDEMVAVELKENHKMIGNVYIGKREYETLEIGYVFNQNYWGNGYAECDSNNKASWKLLEALDFKREGELKKNVYFWKDKYGKPVWKDTYIYAKLNH